MRRLLLKLMLIATPFALYALAVVAIDPFDYFRRSDAAERAMKSSIAGKLDPPLWKLIAYERSPRPHILLGDSRMNSLGEDAIETRIGSPVANLAYGGGSLKEAIRTFWIASGLTELKSVTIGINLDTYNDSNAKDRVGPAETVMRNPGLYIFNRLVALGLWITIQAAATGDTANLGRPPMTHEEFWRYQLDVTATLFYSGYRDPANYRKQLAEIATECARRHIELRFVIFPEHADLVALATRAGLAAQRERMRDELGHFGTTIDFSGRNDWIDDRSLFVDPFHPAPTVVGKIIELLWGDRVN